MHPTDRKMPDPTENCPACGYYKRGEDATCVSCGADWPLTPPAPVLSEQITALRDERERIAALTQTLAERELTARILRLTIETEQRTAGHTQTDAAIAAKSDPRYLDHTRRSIQLSFDHAVALAHAEAMRFEIELQLAVLYRTAGVA